jgi:hypothetical protein
MEPLQVVGGIEGMIDEQQRGISPNGEKESKKEELTSTTKRTRETEASNGILPLL